jgi:phage shock protein C
MRERLYRSRDDRMLFGVAGGMARYFNVDSAIVRLVWVLLFLAAGAGILLYIVAAIVIPEEPAGSAAGTTGASVGGIGPSVVDHPPGQAPVTGRDNAGGAILLGVVLVLVGGWFLLQRFLPQFDPALVWPAILIIVGLVLVVGALRRSGGGSKG